MNFKKPFDPLTYIIRYLPLIILVSTLFFLIASIFIFTNKKFSPRYSAEALLNINPYFSRILYKTEESEWIRSYEDWMRTQVNVVKSYPVLEKAIQNFHDEGFVWRQHEETMQSAVARLSSRLDIKQIRQTQLISISMISSTKDGLAELVNSVVKSYIENERKLRIDEDNFKLDQLSSEKEKINTQLENSYKKLEEVSEKFGTAISDEKNLYVYIESLNDLRSSYNEILVQRIKMQEKLESLSNMEKEIKNLDVSALANKNMDNNTVLLDNLIHFNRKEQEIVEEMVGLKPEHPRHIYLQKKLKELQSQSKKISDSLTEKQKVIIKEKMLTENVLESKEILNEVETLNATEIKIKSELDKLQKDILDYNTAVLKASTSRQEIVRLQNSLNRINERIDQILIESTSPGRMSIQQKAFTPENPSVVTKPKYLALGFIGSVFFSLALAVGLGFMDRRINNLKDIEKVIGFPITGYVIDSSYDSIESNEIYTVFNTRPNSYLYQQYNQISLQLQKEHKDHKSQIYTFSSLKDGDGSTSIALNCLAAINAPKEKKLYINLNTRNSVSLKNHEFYTVCNLEELIENSEIFFDKSSNLPFKAFTTDYNDCNSIKNNISIIEDLLNRLKKDYEYIFIDTSPLLLSSSSLEIATLSDVVILTPKYNSTDWDDLVKGIGILDHLGIKVVSVILNKVTFSESKTIKKKLREFYGDTEDIDNSLISWSTVYDLNYNLFSYVRSFTHFIVQKIKISKLFGK